MKEFMIDKSSINVSICSGFEIVILVFSLNSSVVVVAKIAHLVRDAIKHFL